MTLGVSPTTSEITGLKGECARQREQHMQRDEEKVRETGAERAWWSLAEDEAKQVTLKIA